MDAGDEHMQWFHFRVDGAKGKNVNLRIVNAGEASYPKHGTATGFVQVSTGRPGRGRIPHLKTVF